jgi:ribosome maturation factor RimP
MDSWRKYTVIALIVCLLHLTLVDAGLAANETRLPNLSLTRQRMDQFGVGAKVKVELTNGKKYRRSIQSIGDGEFLLASAKAGSPARIPYGNVAQLNLAKNTYKAAGQPDSVAVRRVVTELGVGHHIMVKTSEAKEYHGNIVAIGAESFTVLPDHTTAPVQIAYNTVRQMGPNPSRNTWIGIAVLGGIAVAVLFLLVWVGEKTTG